MKRVHLILTDLEHSQWWDKKGEMNMTWEEFFRYAITFLPTTSYTVEIEE